MLENLATHRDSALTNKKILRKKHQKWVQKKLPFTRISKFHFLCHSTLVKQKFILLLLYFPINFHRIHSRTFINSHPTHPHVSVCVRERIKIPQKIATEWEKEERERLWVVWGYANISSLNFLFFQRCVQRGFVER